MARAGMTAAVRRSGIRGAVLGVAGSVLVALLAQPAQARDDTETVCRNAADTVNTGLNRFVGEMQDVSDKASGGDLVGAEASVKQGAATLQDISAKLRQQNNADDPKLKQTVSDMAGEFANLGGQLTTLSGLQNVDFTRLDQIGTEMGRICGPNASFPAPSEAPSGVPSGAPSGTPSGTPSASSGSGAGSAGSTSSRTG